MWSHITNNTPVKQEPFQAADRQSGYILCLLGNYTALDQHTLATYRSGKRQTDRQTDREGGKEHHKKAKQGKLASGLDSKTLVDQHAQMTDRQRVDERTERQTVDERTERETDRQSSNLSLTFPGCPPLAPFEQGGNPDEGVS